VLRARVAVSVPRLPYLRRIGVDDARVAAGLGWLGWAGSVGLARSARDEEDSYVGPGQDDDQRDVDRGR